MLFQFVLSVGLITVSLRLIWEIQMFQSATKNAPSARTKRISKFGVLRALYLTRRTKTALQKCWKAYIFSGWRTRKILVKSLCSQASGEGRLSSTSEMVFLLHNNAWKVPCTTVRATFYVGELPISWETCLQHHILSFCCQRLFYGYNCWNLIVAHLFIRHKDINFMVRIKFLAFPEVSPHPCFCFYVGMFMILHTFWYGQHITYVLKHTENLQKRLKLLNPFLILETRKKLERSPGSDSDCWYSKVFLIFYTELKISAETDFSCWQISRRHHVFLALWTVM